MPTPKKQTPPTSEKAAEAQTPATEAKPAATPEPKPKHLVLIADSDTEFAFLEFCQQLYQRHDGFTSPFEEFLINVVRMAQHGHYPSADDLKLEFEEFEGNMEFTKRCASEFVRRYPKEIETGDGVPETKLEVHPNA